MHAADSAAFGGAFALKGHDFIPAVLAAQSMWALAPEGWFWAPSQALGVLSQVSETRPEASGRSPYNGNEESKTVTELESFASTRPEELTAFVGKHMIYTYENGWQYEIYIKNASTVDYRIHSGLVGGRWVRDQKAHIVRLAEQIYKVSWDEPTGTSVSLTFMLATRTTHGAVFFPNWIVNNPGKTVCYQNDHLDEMRAYRDAGPTYPKLVLDEFSALTFVEDCAPDDQSVIACPPSELPAGYAARRN